MPPATLSMIIELVESMSPMLEDAEHSGMTSGFGVPHRKAIKQGDTKGVAEGTANDDEENEFDLLSRRYRDQETRCSFPQNEV